MIASRKDRAKAAAALRRLMRRKRRLTEKQAEKLGALLEQKRLTENVVASQLLKVKKAQLHDAILPANVSRKTLVIAEKQIENLFENWM